MAAATRRYQLPLAAFDELIEGCENDVRGTSYATFDDLVVYCRLVAGSIGRLSLAVFGATTPRAVELADDLGVALQLTNILRDVVEDRGNGRVYLPAEDAIAVGCPPDLSGSEAALAELVAFECARAHEWFERGLQLLPLLDRRSRACVGAMAGIYYRLLVHIERDPHAVTQRRLSLPAAEKVWIAGKSHRWGAAMTAQRVVVVGGGLAGVSAALSLADSGAEVTLLERRLRLGGLTWSFQRNGLSFDNGQHVFLRCCSAYLRFLDRIGARDAVYLQPRLDIPVISPDGTRASISRGVVAGPSSPHLFAGPLPPPHAAGPSATGLARPGPEPPQPRGSLARHGHLRELALPARAERRCDRPALGSHRAAHAECPRRGSLAGAGCQGVPHRPARSGRCRGRRVVDRAADGVAR